MLVKKKLDWKDGARRSAKTPVSQGPRFLLFSKLAGAERFALGAPHSRSGAYSLYELDGALELLEAGLELAFEESFLLNEAEKAFEGEEAVAEGSFLPLEIGYEAKYENEKADAIVTPVLILFSVRAATLCASLKVDDFELLPSARISLAPGLNEIRLRPVKLGRPAKFWGKRERERTEYRMELALWDGGAMKPFIEEKPLELWG